MRYLVNRSRHPFSFIINKQGGSSVIARWSLEDTDNTSQTTRLRIASYREEDIPHVVEPVIVFRHPVSGKFYYAANSLSHESLYDVLCDNLKVSSIEHTNGWLTTTGAIVDCKIARVIHDEKIPRHAWLGDLLPYSEELGFKDISENYLEQAYSLLT